MKEILTNVLTGIACIFIAALFVVGARLFHEFCEKIKVQVKNETLKNLIDKVDYLVQLCVEATNQTFVNDKKDAGEFTDEDKKEAFSITFDSLESMITDIDRDLIIKEFGDVGTFLRTTIENYIKNSKKEL